MNELKETTAEDVLEQIATSASEGYESSLKPSPSEYDLNDPEEHEMYLHALATYEEEAKAPFTMPLPRNIRMDELFLDDNLDVLQELVAGLLALHLADDKDPSFESFRQTDKWLVLGLAMSEKQRMRFEVVWNDMFNKAIEVHDYYTTQEYIDEQADYEYEDEEYEDEEYDGWLD